MSGDGPIGLQAHRADYQSCLDVLCQDSGERNVVRLCWPHQKLGEPSSRYPPHIADNTQHLIVHRDFGAEFTTAFAVVHDVVERTRATFDESFIIWQNAIAYTFNAVDFAVGAFARLDNGALYQARLNVFAVGGKAIVHFLRNGSGIGGRCDCRHDGGGC